MRIYKEYEKSNTYIIDDTWDGKIYADIEDLKDLKKEINKIIRKEKEKNIDK